MTNNISGILRVILLISIFIIAGIAILYIGDIIQGDFAKELAIKALEIMVVIIVVSLAAMFLTNSRKDK